MARWTRAIAALPFKRGRVLDLGCAFGFSTLLLARKGYETVGVDQSLRYIMQARRRHPAGTYLLSCAETLQLADHSFDGVLLLDVLEHVSDQQAVLHEIQRVSSREAHSSSVCHIEDCSVGSIRSTSTLGWCVSRITDSFPRK